VPSRRTPPRRTSCGRTSCGRAAHASLPGFAGIAGLPGFAGIAGLPGFAGIAGLPGFAGIAGLPGFAGIAGGFALGLMLGALPTRAGPDGWTLAGSLSEQLSAVSNPGLNSGSGNQIDLRSTTRLSLSLAKTAATESLAVSGSLAPVLSTQNAQDNILGLLSPNLAANYSRQASRVSLTAGLNASFASTAFLDQLFVDDDGDGIIDPGELQLVTGDAIRARYGGTLGLTWQATNRDSVALSFSARRLDFFDGSVNQVPNTNLGLNGSWNRTLANGLDGRLASGLGWFTSEAPGDPVTLSGSLTAGLSTALSSRLSLSGNLGFSVAETTVGATDTLTLGGTGDLRLTYATPGFSLGMSLSQALQPNSTTGTIQNTTSLGITLGYPVDSLSSLGFTARLQLQNPLGGGGTTTAALRLSPSYSYALDADTSLRLSYNLDARDQGGGIDLSHTVFVSISRSFTLLP
jgi:integrin beta 8